MGSADTLGSFRDPCGRVFTRNGVLYRSVLPPGRAAYEQLMHSGLYEALVRDGLLIPHDDVGPSPLAPDAFTVLRPERVDTVSYPYEWCVSQLREAALATLQIQQRALNFGCWLKDASAFNIQFHRGRPVLIDTLSIEPLHSTPWPAYRQFCQHFYGPLLLAARVDLGLGRLQQLDVDGPSLRLISALLPRTTWLTAGPLLHIHLHAAGSRRWSADAGKRAVTAKASATRRTSIRDLQALADSLARAVRAVRWRPHSNWTTYYGDAASYSSEAFRHKEHVVTGWLEQMRPTSVWDLGANVGHFSRLAARLGAHVLALERDAACVEALVQDLEREPCGNLLPLVFDLANPTPAIGWANEERMTLQARGPADVLLALALVHHLAIGNNVPFPEIASYLAVLGRHLVIEFVPKSDPIVERMLATRVDVFDTYDREHFEAAFGARFEIRARTDVRGSARTLYLMSAR